MFEVTSWQQKKRNRRLTPVMIRIPIDIRERAKSLAKEQSTADIQLTETDVYRSAILFFLSSNSTNSRDSE